MGSLDFCYYCCDKCKGLFSVNSTFTQHKPHCHGDIKEADCEMVACEKTLFVQFILPTVSASSAVTETPADSDRPHPSENDDPSGTPTPRKRGRPRKSTKSVSNSDAPARATVDSPRRYSLREGAAKALHDRIFSMQKLLGGRSPVQSYSTSSPEMDPKPSDHKSDSETRVSSQRSGNQENSDEPKPSKESEISARRQQHKSSIEDSQPSVAAETSSSVTIKRKRGRPRKTVSLSETVTLQENEENTSIQKESSGMSQGSVDDADKDSSKGEDDANNTDKEIQTLVPDGLEETFDSSKNHQENTKHEESYSVSTVTVEVINSDGGVQMEDRDRAMDIDAITDTDVNTLPQEKPTSESEGITGDSTETETRPVLRSKRRQAFRVTFSGKSAYKKRKEKGSAPVSPPDDQGYYHCSLCTYVSRQEGMFRRHMSAHNDGQKYVCQECGAEFVYRRHFNQHLGRHQGFSCRECGKTFTRPHDRDRHARIHNGEGHMKMFSCSSCEYTCHYPNLLREHMRKHTGERYQCEELDCNFKTIYQRALNHHMNTVHNEKKHLVCDMCGYRSNDSSLFGRHVRLHTNKSLKCSQCDYTATSLAYIKAHSLTHTGEKLYECDQCAYKTSRPTGLRLHLMKHVGVKPWQCPLCVYSSTTKQKVQRHIDMRHGGKGTPKRRNVCVKFDTAAFRINKSEEQASCKPKYLVIETVVDPTDSALVSNMVGQEVVVNETVESAGDDQLEGEENCLYKCAFCDFTQPLIETIQDHMAVEHTEQVAGEILQDSCMLEPHGEEEDQEEPQQVTILLASDTLTEDAEITVATQEEAADLMADSGSVETTVEDATGIVRTEVLQASSLQDDAVSTAVESILHLQHIPVKDGAPS